MDCLLAFEMPDGVWCLKFKGIVSDETAAKCRDFLPKHFGGCKECEEHERKNSEDVENKLNDGRAYTTLSIDGERYNLWPSKYSGKFNEGTSWIMNSTNPENTRTLRISRGLKIRPQQRRGK